MKNKRTLWIILFSACFLTGLIQGVFLSFKDISSAHHYSKKIYILNQYPELLPLEVIREVEKQIQAQIIVTEFKNLTELNSLIIAQDQYSIILASEPIVDLLDRQNFTERIQTVINQEIHEDFVRANYKDLSFFLPIFWLTYDFWTDTKIEKIQLYETLNNRQSKFSFYFPKQIDLLYSIIQEVYKKESISVDSVDIERLNVDLKPLHFYESILEFSPQSINLVPHTLRNYYQEKYPQFKKVESSFALPIYKIGFGILKYKPDRALAFSFIHAYLKAPIQNYLAEKNIFASTLKVSSILSNDLKKATTLRDMEMKKYRRTEKSPVEWERLELNP